MKIDDVTINLRGDILGICESMKIEEAHCIMCLANDRTHKLTILSRALNVIVNVNPH